MQLWKRKSGVVDRCPYIIVNGKKSVIYLHEEWALDSNSLEGDLEESYVLAYEVGQEGYAKLLITLLDEVTKHVTV